MVVCAGLRLNDSYSEANAQTCIKITKLVSVFCRIISYGRKSRSQASVAPGGKKSNSDFSIFLERKS